MLGRRIKQIAFCGLVLTALLMVGVLMLPTILGTKWIYQPLVDRLAADDFDLSIDSVHLRWFTPLRFERIYIAQADGLGLVSIAEIRSNRSLFGFLLGGRQLGRIEIVCQRLTLGCFPTLQISIALSKRSRESQRTAVIKRKKNCGSM